MSQREEVVRKEGPQHVGLWEEMTSREDHQGCDHIHLQTILSVVERGTFRSYRIIEREKYQKTLESSMDGLFY